MFDHVKFGVSNYAASKAFFLQALEPLGVTVVAEGPPAYGVELSAPGKASLCLFQTVEKPAHLCTWRSGPIPARRWMPSIAQRCRRAAKTMGRRACAPITTPITMPLSSRARTATTSKWCAMNPLSDLCPAPPSAAGRAGWLAPASPAQQEGL